MKRLGLLLVLAAVGGAASAETFVAKIYGVPAGYDSMIAMGAGNGGMMTGSAIKDLSYSHAATLTPQGFRSLHPTGWFSSEIYNSWGGTYHVGGGYQTNGSPSHALLWIGGGPAIDLHPSDPSVLSTGAAGVEGQYQCGGAGLATTSKACVWMRTASSFRMLPSTGYTVAQARTIDVSQPGGIQVAGWGSFPNFAGSKGMLWKGLNSEPISLHPGGGYRDSLILDSGNGVQAGYVEGFVTGDKMHAARWSGSAASFADIHPSAFSESRVTAVRGKMLAGFGKAATSPTRNQAILWYTTTGNNWVNLHAKLPHQFRNWHSIAQDIDDQGNVVGYVGSPDHSTYRPVIWLKVP